MITLVTRYYFLVFWAVQVLAQTRFNYMTGPVMNSMIAIYLLIGTFLLLTNSRYFFNPSFRIIHIILLVYLIYWVLFDHSVFGIQYLLAKFSIYAMIASTLYFHYEYVRDIFPLKMLQIGTIILTLGVLTNHSFGARYGGAFGNPNSLGIMSALMFIIALFYLEKGYKRTLLLLFFISLVLMSGSRNAAGGLFLAYLFKDGFSIKKIIVLVTGAIMLLGINKITTSYGFTTGIDRLISSEKHHKLLAGRDVEFKLGFLSIEEKPLEGHGLDHYAHLSDKIVVRSGVLRHDVNFARNPHNSFIGLFIQLGIPFGIIVLLTLLYYIGKSLLFKPRNEVFLLMMLYLFLAGFFESYVFGVNGFEGTTFWFALIFYQIYMDKERSNRCITK